MWAGSHSPHDRDVFMTCGGNGSLNLWKYSYPKSRKEKDEETGKDRGVAGTLKLINSSLISSQPISSFDWHADMVRMGVCENDSLFACPFHTHTHTRTHTHTHTHTLTLTHTLTHTHTHSLSLSCAAWPVPDNKL